MSMKRLIPENQALKGHLQKTRAALDVADPGEEGALRGEEACLIGELKAQQTPGGTP